jgi:hypothetical protein
MLRPSKEICSSEERHGSETRVTFAYQMMIDQLFRSSVHVASIDLPLQKWGCRWISVACGHHRTRTVVPTVRALALLTVW